MMKKICLILAVLMVLSCTLTLFSCGKDEPEDEKKPSEQQQEPGDDEPGDKDPDDGPKEPVDERTGEQIWKDLTPSEGDGDKWSDEQ